MKKKYLLVPLLFLCCMQGVFAQLGPIGPTIDDDEVYVPYATQISTIFEHLEKNRVPHGILTDFGLEYVDLTAYDGNLTNENHTSRATVHESFYTLISSRIREVNTGFMQPVDFEKLWHNQRTQGIITLGGLYFKYSKFKDDARTSGKVTVINNQVYDVYNRGTWQNPYEEKSMFVLAPSVNQYKGLNVQVKLPQNIFLSNYPSQIQSVAVDFQDGLGYRTIAYNQILNVSYTQTGTYVWKYKLNLTNGTILYSHSEVVIKKGLQTQSAQNLTTLQPRSQTGNTFQENPNLDVYFKTTVTATVPYYGKNATATLYIRDADGDNQITNPLIVAEGFDTGAVLNPEQEAGDSNIEDFIESYLFNQSRSALLQNELDTYDIIYVDWDNGVDFIQRNAFAFQEAIRWVNDTKTTNTPNTVIGQSMGGLVARYALADIEQNQNFNHDTTLYISHDAPHLGANTPISLQHFNRHIKGLYQRLPIAYAFADVLIPLAYDGAAIFADSLNDIYGTNLSVDQYVAPSEYLGVADFPASRQMLYNWVAPNYTIFNGVHDVWQLELSNMGYPQGDPNVPIRNIAISNGSECGVTQAIQGDITGISKDAADKTVLNAVIGITDLGVAAALVIGGDFLDAVWLTTLAIVPGSSSYDIDFYMRPMVQLNQNKEIYYGRIRYKKKVLWFIPVNVNFTKVTQHQPNGILPYDTYGGGWFNPESVLNELPSAISNFLGDIQTQAYGFIPTASSLDAGSGTTNLDDFDYRRDYVGETPPAAPKNSPFENFVTHFDPFNIANNNSAHISFNRRNGDWLFAELNDNQNPIFTNCSMFCDEDLISGPGLVCNSAIYIINGLDNFTTVTWTLDNPNSAIITGNNNAQITLTKAPGFNGFVTLTAQINSPRCGFVVRTKRIYLGVPTGSPTISGDNDLNPGPTDSAVFSVNTNSVSSFSSINWTIFSYSFPNAIQYFTIQPTGNGKTIVVTANSNVPEGDYIVQARITNTCGFIPVDKEFHVNEGGNAQFYPRFFTVSPNPSNGIINIQLKDTSKTPQNQQEIQGELYDIYGRFKEKVIISNYEAKVITNRLTTGIYVLKIYMDKTVESHQIIVK
ncbi:T9SS type A sorting domain-containing protein [Kordia jejudonensis]|uniref:T9SS type A sorting domain-containing protein n=1 Tax=Kordia jejudonensis TaxID=1348245 RepID=UPI0009E29595|nr:T9SS type A sorting domain-containing protein [Kordia jejudonensis]